MRAPGPAQPERLPSPHQRFFVADLHADTLLWERDLLRRGRWGHTDAPRLHEGGVDLQVFTVVTKTPLVRQAHGAGAADCVPSDGVNTTGLLSVLQLRPLRTWTDLRERALYQARRLEDAARRSRLEEGGVEVILVRTADDLARVVTAAGAAKAGRGPAVLGAVLGLEGANWIGGPEASDASIRAEVRTLFAAGFRTFALTHRFNNALAGASEGCGEAASLTWQGAVALEEAEVLGMVVDLAHLSPTALQQALGRLRHPPLISHTGVRAHCPPPGCTEARNLRDEDLVGVARLGGLIGIGFWPEAVGAGGRGAVVSAFARAADVLRAHGFGEPWRHLAYGSDFDGAVSVPFDAAGLPSLTLALSEGQRDALPVPRAALARVVGDNACRLLATRLPGGGTSAANQICTPAMERAQ